MGVDAQLRFLKSVEQGGVEIFHLNTIEHISEVATLRLTPLSTENEPSANLVSRLAKKK
jgi:hypothetical protein